MELAEHHEWWKHQGGQELRRLLMERWDPIGVKDAPEAASEYDGYRGAVIQLLRGGASPERIAAHLAEVQETRMGISATPQQLLPVGEQLVRWYDESLARWRASHPDG